MTNNKPKIWIFYSSETEPELLTFCADTLAYLRDQNIELEIIDTFQNTEKAKEFKVKSTPTLLTEQKGEIKERYKVTSYLDGMLEREELKKIVENS